MIEDKDQERLEHRLLNYRNLGIAIALLGVAGIAYFGMALDQDRVALAYTVIAGLGSSAALYCGRKLGQYRSARAWTKDDNAVSPVIAVILMVAITVILATAVFFLVADIGGHIEVPPSMGFTADDDARTITVSSVNMDDLLWGEFLVQGCTAPDANDTVSAGDTLTNCSGVVKVVHEPSNSMVYITRRFE